MTRYGSWAAGIVAAPVLAMLTAVLWVTVGEHLGLTPFSGGGPRNSAEAAAMGNGAETIRLLRAGDDPAALHSVRPEIISSSVPLATTPEAAMWSRQSLMFHLLDREHALGGPEERRTLACLASDLGLPEVVEYLVPADPPVCAPGEALKRIQARANEQGR